MTQTNNRIRLLALRAVLVFILGLGSVGFGWFHRSARTQLHAPRITESVAPGFPYPGVRQLIDAAQSLHATPAQLAHLQILGAQEQQAEARPLAAVRDDAGALQTRVQQTGSLADPSTRTIFTRYQQDSVSLAAIRSTFTRKALVILTPEQRIIAQSLQVRRTSHPHAAH